MPSSPVLKLWPAMLLAAQCLAIGARAGEVCRFAGSTDYGGEIAVTAITGADAASGTTTVDVRLGFKGTPMLFVHTNYLLQEISTWKGAQLESLAVNSRYRVDGHVVRQLWDVFERGSGGLRAFRLEAKRRHELRARHPAFIDHWDAAAFGQPWLHDYWRAAPERRRDLDLPAGSAAPQLRSPLALAFYWAERLPHAGQVATVFLPGFKRDKSVALAIEPAGPPSKGVRPWIAAVRYPALGTSRASTAEAWVAADRHLLQLAVQLRTRNRTADAVIHQQGCISTPDGN